MSAPQRPELKYAVNFIHRQTGERREAIVSFVDLSPEARKFLDRNRITRPDAAPCIERALAYDLARKQVPGEFFYDFEDPNSCRVVH
jgi:DNA-binding TFAR19-related protein (PDSD5 family)